jgi:hypothetical protein
MFHISSSKILVHRDPPYCPFMPKKSECSSGNSQTSQGLTFFMDFKQHSRLFQAKNKSFSIFYCPIVRQYSEDGHGITDTTVSYGIIVFLY